jgi:1-acyl-sn-glycerol-3-phosphate acyltransferase
MILAIIKLFFILLYTLFYSILTIVLIPFDRDGIKFHALTRPWSKGILFLCGVKLRIKGLENIKKNENYVFVSNHASLVDIPITQACLPGDFRFVAKKELTKIPIWGFALKHGGYIIIDRGNSIEAMRSLERAAEKIKKGISVILFPEGTRSPDGNIQSFKRGSFLLAAKTGIPIVPISIKGSFSILPKKQLRVKGGVVDVIIDKPIPTDNIKNKKEELELMEKVRNVIVENFLKADGKWYTK